MCKNSYNSVVKQKCANDLDQKKKSLDRDFSKEEIQTANMLVKRHANCRGNANQNHNGASPIPLWMALPE